MKLYIEVKRGAKRKDEGHGTEIGMDYRSPFKHQNGLDAFDLEAERQGMAEGRLRGMSPRRHHIQTV